MKQYCTDEEAFFDKITIPPFVDACWTWNGEIINSGYGTFYVRSLKKRQLAHRYSYELHYSPIPGKLTIDHACFNKLCVNPKHLYLATRDDNRNIINQMITHCKRGHEYNEENTRLHINKKGWRMRHCKLCHTINERERRHRIKNETIC